MGRTHCSIRYSTSNAYELYICIIVTKIKFYLLINPCCNERGDGVCERNFSRHGKSSSNTYPYMEIDSDDVSIEHEARVSRISEEQLFYLMSRGMSEQEASLMIVSGFLDPLVKQLPMEYAVELNRLIELEMEGTVG